MSIIRPLAFTIAFAVPFMIFATSKPVVAQQASAQETLKQVALSDAQIEAFLVARPEIAKVLDKEPQGDASDQPDAKVVATLDATAQKNKLADYAEYESIADNVGLVMAGIDAQTKKYVGTEAILKQEIADVEADKNMSTNDKKQQLEQLNAELQSPEAVKFASNINLVLKYYDKLSAVPQQDQ